MLDQLIIGANRSYEDFEASVREHKIIDGNKKTIKETVPFSNKVYDFSKIDGELYWEEKTLEYTLELTASSAEELSVKVTKLKSWLMNVMDENLYDPYIPDYHFVATFASISVDDSEIEKANVSVTFTAYPYMIANVPKVYECDLTANKSVPVPIHNKSGHRVTPTFNASVPFILEVGDNSFSVPSGETTDENFKLDSGIFDLTLTATENGNVSITFYEEVF